MKRTCLSITLASAALLSTAPLADANNPMICGERNDIIKQLKSKYGEIAQSRGLTRGTGLVELFANSNSGSWTIVITNPAGTSCLMAAGEAFEAMELPLGDAPA